MPTKYYAVRKGRKPGIYTTWPDCQKQTSGFSGAVFKSFETYEEAYNFAYPPEPKVKSKKYDYPISAYTDGSFVDYGRSGWGYIMLAKDKPFLEAFGPCELRGSLRNIGGEIQAAVEAIKKAATLGADAVYIYHDYAGIGCWANHQWKTNRPETESYVQFVDQMRQAIDISFIKVEGHSGNKYNEIADALAFNGTCVSVKVEQPYVDEEPEQMQLEDISKASAVEETPVQKVEITLDFRTILKNWRKEKKLTQAQAATVCNLKSYAQIERGKNAKVSPKDIHNLYAIIAPQGVEFQDFLLLWANSEQKKAS